MPCLDEQKLLAFAEGRASATEKDSVEAHLDACTDCRRLASTLARTLASTGAPIGAAPLPAGIELQRGASVGRYVVLERIGEGGMGVVYSAYDPELDRIVCLKLLRPERSSAKGSRVREAQALAQLSHANIVAVHDAGTMGDQLFVAMEWVDGGSLSAWVKEKPREWREVLNVFLDAGRGLAAAHAAGWVHRDFKPDNVLVGKRGEVRVSDFGLAQSMEAEPSDESGISGTLGYLAPEQFEGAAASALTDQFSFCVALYEALHGERPFRGKNLQEQAAAVKGGQLPAPRRKLPAWLRKALTKGLSVSPAQRFPSMDALLRTLSGEARARRNRWALAALAATVLVAVVVARRPSNVCGGAEEKLAGVWDPERGRVLRDAFLATHKPYAAFTLAQASKALDDYAGAWASAHRSACEATRVTGEQSEALLDQRMHCLDVRRGELKALVDVLAAADADVVSRASTAVQQLSPLHDCEREALLNQPALVPSEPKRARRAKSIEAELAQVKALHDAGKYREGLERAKATVEAAHGLGWRPLEAEALYMRGRLERLTSNGAAAEKTYFAALAAASAGKHDGLLPRIWLELVHVQSSPLGQREAAAHSADLAQAGIERLGGNAQLSASLENQRGVMLRTFGAHAEAAAAYRRALAIRESAKLDEDLEYATVKVNLAAVLEMLGEYDASLALHDEALQLLVTLVGPDHPHMATAMNNRALVLEGLGREQEALEIYTRVLELRRVDLGPDHVLTATALNNLCGMQARMGSLSEALKNCQQAKEILEKVLPAEHPDLAPVLNSLGDALRRSRRYHEALDTYQRALARRERAYGKDHPGLAYSLTGMGQTLLDAGRVSESLAPLRRALALRQAPTVAAELKGETELVLAQALLRAERRAEAVALAKAASEHFSQAGPKGRAGNETALLLLSREGRAPQRISADETREAQPR